VSANGSTAAATWSQVELARHPDRPYALDYIHAIFGSFFELHGDRLYGDDHAIIGGPTAFDGRTVMVIAQQKGRTTAERAMRNFGMANPEGYRKALRLLRQAEKFQFPVISLVDTSGAFPGAGAEERGIAWAIAENLVAFAQAGLLVLIATPVVRVMASVVAFVLERDRLYAAITIAVLAILLVSLFGLR